MKKIISLIIVCTIIISGMFIYKNDNKKTFTDDNSAGPIIAAFIDGEESTTFPTNSKYVASVECTKNGVKQNVGAKATWNGTKWVVSIDDISAGNVRCSANFVTPTLTNLILANNEVKKPLTTPGRDVAAYTLDDAQTYVANVSTDEQNYYITYASSWTVGDVRMGFDLTFELVNPAVTYDTYANSYSSLVGKYLPYSTISCNDLSCSGQKTAGTKSKTTGLKSVIYIVSATSNSFTYKRISSNKNMSESLLASTEDDYGTSYYYRGNVKDNYVQFANKCWRIVRITGDGSVKLVLHNDNVSDATNPCSSVNNNDTAAFAHYDGTSYISLFNSNYNDNTYMGFMYGATGASDYTSTHANTNKSVVLTNLETWYKNNLAPYESKLADTIWCNDKKTFKTYTQKGTTTYGTGLGYGTNVTGYGAYDRIYGDNFHSYAKPSLVCPDDNDGGKLSKFTVNDTINGNGKLTYKIGLLTADEVAFAGAVYSIRDSLFYLGENVGDTLWWTMSPANFTSNQAYIFDVKENYLGIAFSAYGSAALRPAISLVSGIEVTSGTGTSEDPYVVN